MYAVLLASSDLMRYITSTAGTRLVGSRLERRSAALGRSLVVATTTSTIKRRCAIARSVFLLREWFVLLVCACACDLLIF